MLAFMATLMTQAAPKVVWLNPVHNFGAFKEDVGPVTVVYKGVNVGDEPLVILDARANCGCTTPSYSREPVAPGDTIRMSVSYDPSGRPGRFNKHVKVKTNAENADHQLVLKGTVIGGESTLASRYPERAGNTRFSNKICAFGETYKGRMLAAAVNIYNPTTDTIFPTVVDMPRYIAAVFQPKAIAPGEQGTLSMTAYTGDCPDYGIVTDSFKLVPDTLHPADVLNVETVMIINEDFSRLTTEQLEKAPKVKVSVPTVDFGMFTHTSGSISQQIKVFNEGKSDLIIRRATCPDAAVTVSLSTMRIAPGKSATMTIKVNAALLPADATLLNARIQLITNTPSQPTTTIRAVGEIK